MIVALAPPEIPPSMDVRLRGAVEDACAHGGPCTPCRTARVQALVKTFDRERTEALREVKARIEDAEAGKALIILAAALEGHPRDTDLDSALTLLARTHAILRRTKTPRPDPEAMKAIEDYLASNGIEVSRE